MYIYNIYTYILLYVYTIFCAYFSPYPHMIATTTIAVKLGDALANIWVIIFIIWLTKWDI